MDMWVTPMNDVLDGVPASPSRQGANFGGNGATQCNIYGECGIVYVKTAKPIQHQFGMVSRVGRRNRVFIR